VLKSTVILVFRKIRRQLLRLFPQATLDLSFAGRPLPNGMKRIGTYSRPEILEADGVLRDRPVSHSFAQRDFYSLENAVIDPSMGEIYLESKEFLIQSTPWHPYVPSPERRPPLIRAPKKLENPHGFIRLPAWTYYHQVAEYLPPYLFLREKFPNAITLIPENGSKLAREILNSLGISYTTHDRPALVNKLFFVGHGADSGYPHPRDISILRSTLIPLAKTNGPQENSSGSPKALYVSRVNSTRSPVNEKNFVSRLESLQNFQVLQTETLSFLEQIKVFAEADFLVGVHGAGLTNQIWMKPGSSILELIEPAYLNPVFNALAKTCGHNYKAIFLEKDRDERPVIDEDYLLKMLGNN
jgi:hypothetical protein